MKETSINDNKYTLQSVTNALKIIDLLGIYDEMNVTAISQALSIGKSTAFRLLATLEINDFVKKSANNRYRLAMKFSYLGSKVLLRLEITRIAHPLLEKLSAVTGEAAHLVIWDENNLVRYVDKVSASTSVSMDSYIGMLKECYTTATGKVLLAYKSDEFIEEYLKNITLVSLTPFTVTDIETLRRYLLEIRQSGYCLSRDEDELGFTCYAAPIFDSSQIAVAAISVSGPTPRMLEEKRNLKEIITNTARNLSNQIGLLG